MQSIETLSEAAWGSLAAYAHELSTATRPSLVGSGVPFAAQFPKYRQILNVLASAPIPPSAIEITGADRKVVDQRLYAAENGDALIELDVRAVLHALEAGATVLLPKVNKIVPALGAPSGLLLPDAYGSVDVFAFISSPSTQSYGAHHDLIDALIVQIEGSKYWRGWALEKGERPGDGTVSYDVDQLGRPDLELVLEPGQVVMLPMNLPHVVQSRGEITFHLAVGFRRPQPSA